MLNPDIQILEICFNILFSYTFYCFLYTFTPNGDGLNDIFRPVLKLERAYNTMDFLVYNRYGQLIHATANMNHGWDGMFNGRPADKGVYSYKLVIYFLDGTNKVFTGEVTLIR